MPRSTLVVRQQFESAMARLRSADRTTELSALQGWHLPLRPGRAKQDPFWDQAAPMPLTATEIQQERTLAADWNPPLLVLREKQRVATWQKKPAALANLHLVEEGLFLRRPEPRSGQVDRPAARARLQDSLLLRVEQPAVLLARARQYSRYPGPCAPSPEKPAARKCNRAARCGDHPIFARYRLPRNRRVLAGYDNRCSRLPHKRAGRARPFPIAALDRCRCLPRRIED